MDFLKRPGRHKALLLLILAAIIILAKVFLHDNILKTILETFPAIGGIYAVATALFPDHEWVQKTDRYIRGNKLLRIFFKDRPVFDLDSNNRNLAKQDFLFKISVESGRLEENIKDVNIYSWELKVNDDFENGSEYFDKFPDWENYIDNQLFQVILGDSGIGKSYELIKRLGKACQHIESDYTDAASLAKKKMPVYIPLKALTGAPDTLVIYHYLKSDGSTFKSMSDDRLWDMIDRKQVIYFFDGLDEVMEYEWYSYLKAIEKMAKETTVFFSCRKEIYDEIIDDLYTKPNKVQEIKPAKVVLKPLTEHQIFAEIEGSEYLGAVKKEKILAYIRSHEYLLKHLSFPLILNLFLKVFDDLSDKDKIVIQTPEQEDALELLWCKFEDYIVARKHATALDTEIIKNRTYTVWMAKIMGRSSFDIDTIQPNWLQKVSSVNEVVPSKSLQVLYYLMTRITAAVLIGISVGSIIARPLTFLGNSILGGLIVTMLAGMFKKMRGNDRGRRLNKLTEVAYVLLLTLALVIICGTYQGFVVPREDKDMYRWYFSFTEATPGMLLGVVLSVVFSYRIIMEANEGNYIVPVEKYKFNWPHAWKEGLIWGVLVAIAVGGFALSVKHFFPDSSFIARWLPQTLDDISVSFTHRKVATAYVNLVLFAYAFTITFIVSFLIIIILASRYKDIRVSSGDKNRLNYGIKTSLLTAAMHTLLIIGIVSLLYSFMILKFGIASIWHGIFIAFGMSILAFLWVGGLEVMNHIILRVNLYFRGIAPLNYDPWLKFNRDMALVKEVGPSLSFYHNTLADYFSKYKLAGNDRIRLKEQLSGDKWFYCIFLAVAAFLIYWPFQERFINDHFWKVGSEFHVDKAAHVQKLTDTTFLVLKTGRLTMNAEGTIHIGTFTGYSSPAGITAGFMGVPIKAAYNLQKIDTFRHASFLYKKSLGSGRWSKYYYVLPEMNDKEDTIWSHVAIGDTLHFWVNDREFQNNSDHYGLIIDILDNKKLKK